MEASFLFALCFIQLISVFKSLFTLIFEKSQIHILKIQMQFSCSLRLYMLSTVLFAQSYLGFDLAAAAAAANVRTRLAGYSEEEGY